MYLTKTFNTPSRVIPLYRMQQELRLFTAAETAQNHQQSSYWINKGSWQIILATCQTTKSNPNIAESNLPLLAFLSSSPSSRDKPWGYMVFKQRETVLAAVFHSCQHSLGKHLAYFTEQTWLHRVTLKSSDAWRKRGLKGGLPLYEWTT